MCLIHVSLLGAKSRIETNTSQLEVRTHLTGNGRKRVSIGDELDDIINSSEVGSSTWAYISGPNAFIAAGEAACKERQSKGVEWYGAKWDI